MDNNGFIFFLIMLMIFLAASLDDPCERNTGGYDECRQQLELQN